ATVAEMPPGTPGDAAIVTFTSQADAAAAEIVRLVAAGYHAVTSCEELAAPDRHLRLGIATSAHSDDRVVVATGVNPGFIMDRLPLVVARACRNVASVTVRRSVDISGRRDQLVTKSGRGMTPEEFAAGVRGRTVGKIGLIESARLLAEGLGWRVQDVAQAIEPIVEDGTTAGLHQRTRLKTVDGRSISLDLLLAWGLDDPHDELTIDGEPPLSLRIDGGVSDDEAAVAQMTAALEMLPRLDPGFYRPIDLPLTAER
ncbi:MAG: hypothetical protein R3290_13680, partial [Acidimicrobiia bacterium]|nr:hypothetical protein [Acidimicrobiia bacterium]